MKHYLTNIFKSNTSSDDIKEKVDHWLDSFEKFHKKDIIMTSESLNYFFPGESWYITVRPPTGFINQENETRCYFNRTIQILYYNVLFRQLILNIGCYTTMISLDKKNEPFVHHYQNIMIVKELQKSFGEIYLGGNKIIATDVFYIVANIRIYFQIDTA